MRKGRARRHKVDKKRIERRRSPRNVDPNVPNSPRMAETESYQAERRAKK
jgi:hypothetical protein